MMNFFKCMWVVIGMVMPVVAADKPNIIFIMADDLGWRDVVYAGAEYFETPNIDRLASEGMVHHAAYSGGPNCAPTRACIISGAYTPRHTIYQPSGRSKGQIKNMKFLVPAVSQKNKKLAAKAAEEFKISTRLDPKFVCIAEVLKTAGYTTARLGKWHLGEDVQGFDLSDPNGLNGKGDNFYGDIDVAEQLTDRALKFIEDKKEGPFFLYLTHWDVHGPIRAREKVVAKYRSKLEEIPEGQRRNFDPTYAGMIQAVDTSVGRVVAKVDELGLAENTLIVFTSDNGGITRWSQLDPLRGVKGSLYEGGVRIPCVMRWKGKIEMGSSCSTPITSVDYLPTFASLAKAELPKDQTYDGVDVSPLMTGGAIPDRAIFWHYPLYLDGKGLEVEMGDGSTYSWRGFPSTSMRRGNYKMIEFHETDTVALYDLSKDPGEYMDVSAELPEVTKKLRAELDAWQESTQAPIPSTLNPEFVGLKKLKASR